MRRRRMTLERSGDVATLRTRTLEGEEEERWLMHEHRVTEPGGQARP